MPQVTNVTPQKRKDRLNIFLDDKYAFSVGVENLLKYNLKVGADISDEIITKITKSENVAKLMDRATNFLSFRPRSEKETRDYLAKKIATDNGIKYSQAIESPLIEITLKKLRKYNLLNDKEFAKWWLKSRSSQSKGKNLIKYELASKGIEKQILEDVLKSAPSQTALAQKAIQKKLRRIEKLPAFEKKKKVYQYLTQRGFNFEVIEEIIAKIGKKV